MLCQRRARLTERRLFPALRTPPFDHDLREAGLTEFTRDDLIEMYSHGVDAAFVREMQGLGFTNLAPGEWIELRDNGVEGDDTADQDEWEG